MLKNALFYLLTVALLPALPVSAVEAPMPAPVVVAESEAFEIVGRLEADGFIFYVDRAPTNAPVMAASLEVEAGGRKAMAHFRPAQGDYLIDDARWLKPLRAPGDYVLSLTLLSGEEGDLLSADLRVPEGPSAAIAGRTGWMAPMAGLGLLLLIAILGRQKWRQRQGGVA